MDPTFLKFGLPISLIFGFIGGLVTIHVNRGVGNTFRLYATVILIQYIAVVLGGATLYIAWNIFFPGTIDLAKSLFNYSLSFAVLFGSNLLAIRLAFKN